MKVAAARAAIATAMQTDRPAFLSFSGGKESVVLASLCEPWRDRIALLWVNTGQMAPHMVDFVMSYRDRFRLHELRSDDPSENWQAHGIPADIAPLPNMMGLAEPKMQPWVNCCNALRHRPLLGHLQAIEPCTLIHGQRRSDPGGERAAQGVQASLPAHVEMIGPLWDWLESDVMAHIRAERLALPIQYGEGLPDSLECLACPAPISAARLRFLDRHYPDVATETRALLATTLAAVDAFTDNLRSLAVRNNGREPS